MLSVGPITKLTSISQTPTYLYMKLPCTYLEKKQLRCNTGSSNDTADMIISVWRCGRMRSTECYCSSLLVEISVKVVDATSSTVKMENKVCCKSARHWLTALPWQLHRDNKWMWHRPAVVFQMPDTYRLHYQRRPAQYIISAKPARSEATWRLVCTGNKSPQLHGFSVLFCS